MTLTNVTLPSSGTITIGKDDTTSNGSFILSNTSGTLTNLTGNLTIVTNYSGVPVTMNSAITGSGGLTANA